MNQNEKSKRATRARNYARNRTKLNRRGFEKFQENDWVFILKLIASIFSGSFWLKLVNGINIAGVFLAGFPIGLIVGIFIIAKFERRSEDRKLFYAVILICAILSYFIPSGIVL